MTTKSSQTVLEAAQALLRVTEFHMSDVLDENGLCLSAGYAKLVRDLQKAVHAETGFWEGA